jgi:DNA (cytosine-5)-methyltransferase 1
MPTLNAFDNGDIRTTVAVLMRMREGKPGGGKGPLLSEDKSLTIATNNDQTLFTESSVRRLTPVECERLQGFPDGWTEGQSDSTRYKQMGNAVAVPVVDWIIEGIVATL